MGDLLFQRQLHQFLGGRTHILEPLSEGYDCKSHTFEILHHLHRTPAVEGDFSDVVLLAHGFDKLFDVAVVDDVSFRRVQKSLLLPYVIRDMIPPDTKGYVFLRYPEVGQHNIVICFILRREY